MRFPLRVRTTRMRDRGAVFAALLMRDGDRCYICGDPATGGDRLQIEHVRSGVDGGSDDMSNLALAHGSCNRIKGPRSYRARERSQ